MKDFIINRPIHATIRHERHKRDIMKLKREINI